MNLIIALILGLLVYKLVEVTYSKNWDKDLEVTVNFSRKEAFAGEEATLIETVTNSKMLPLPILLLKFSTSSYLKFKDNTNSAVTDKYYRNDLISVMMNQKYQRELKFLCTHRGIFRIDDVTLVSYNMFFQDKEVIKYNLGIDLVVYPKIVDTSDFNIMFKNLLGEVVVKRNLIEDPFEFNGIRDYQLTDNMKMINWSASAKSMELKVNTHNYSISQKVRIVINLDTEKGIRNKILEEVVISLGASFANGFINEGIQTSCFVNAYERDDRLLDIPLGSGEQHLKNIWYTLAKLDLDKNIPVDFYNIGTELIKSINKDEIVIFITSAMDVMLQKLILDNLETGTSFTWIYPCNKEMVVDTNVLVGKLIPWYM